MHKRQIIKMKSFHKRPNTTSVVDLRVCRYDVFIGRGSIWGNPFHIGKDGTRSDVIKKYRYWISEQPDLLKQLEKLRGKVLGCFCKPKACHGDVLVDLLNE